MGVIVRAYSEVDGSVARASSVNRVIDDLYTLQNGNLNSANIDDSGIGANNFETSAVITRAIDASAVEAAKIGNTAVLTRTINSEAVTLDKVAYEVLLAREVFS